MLLLGVKNEFLSALVNPLCSLLILKVNYHRAV